MLRGALCAHLTMRAPFYAFPSRTFLTVLVVL